MRYVSAQPIALVSLHFVTLVLCNVTLHNCVCKTELFRKTPFSRGHSCTALQLDLLQAVFLMAADSYPNFFANCTFLQLPTGTVRHDGLCVCAHARVSEVQISLSYTLPYLLHSRSASVAAELRLKSQKAGRVGACR